MNLRKIVLAAAVVACVSVAANADVHPNAIGLRFWSGSIFGAEINYQMGMGEANRLEIGFGGGSNSYNDWYDWYGPNGSYERVRRQTHEGWFGAFGAYQWYWNISRSAARGGFNWYAGPGVGVGFWNKSVDQYRGSPVDYNNEGKINLDAGGQIGIEFDFNVLGAPIVVSIDTRPVIRLLDGGYIDIINLGLGVRYTF